MHHIWQRWEVSCLTGSVVKVLDSHQFGPRFNSPPQQLKLLRSHKVEHVGLHVFHFSPVSDENTVILCSVEKKTEVLNKLLLVKKSGAYNDLVESNTAKVISFEKKTKHAVQAIVGLLTNRTR